MDDEMIERVAQEILAAGFKVPAHDIALVAIRAMREPTPDMRIAALHDYMYREKLKQPWNGRAMWQAMIDSIVGKP